ncbi:MAG: hypothetical protein WCI94_09465 [Rhodospirillales bacterium]
MTDDSDAGSWNESRRLIISQLRDLDGSIRELSARIDKYSETAREKASEVAKEAQAGIIELNLRVAMLELRAKMWGAFVGLVAGSAGTLLVEVVRRTVVK